MQLAGRVTAIAATALMGVALAACTIVQKHPAVEKAVKRAVLQRPELVDVSHWPGAPWPGEEILARACFARLPEGAVVESTWRGIDGGMAGKSGRVQLTPDAAPDPFTGLTVYRGTLATGLREGDALAYRVEVTAPKRTEPWVSYEVPLLVSAKGTEYRGMWVQTWAPAIFNAEQCRKLIDDARKANVNAICVEIRRRGDAFFNSSIEPRNGAIEPDGFDPLAELLRVAHDTSGGKQRIEVHGWFVIYPVGRGETAQNHPDWATRLRDGSSPSGETIFDPGHPGVLDYTVDVIADCVKKYDLDGVNYDYVRYLEGQERPKPEALALYRQDKNLSADAEINFTSDEWREWVRAQPDGSVYNTFPTGYNPVSIERFNRVHGRKADAVPDADDPAWKEWKRDQVTAFVRKAYTRINQIRPECKVTADTTGFGGIHTWDTSAPMNAVFQDWTGWMRSHLIDANFHMGYKREHVPAQKEDYRNWTRFMIENDGGRFQVTGQGAYLNAPDAYRDQVEFARSLRSPGTIYYCYQGYAPRDADMSRDAWIDWAGQEVFSTPAAPPAMPWKKHPQTGILYGTVTRASGKPIDTGRVLLLGTDGQPVPWLLGTDLITKTDGTGFFAFTRVPPGEYAVAVVDRDGYVFRNRSVTVTAGGVVKAF